jgi:hypothetical protein
MRTRIAFQYLSPDSSRPDDRTLPQVFAEMSAEDTVPHVGDIITMLPQPPSRGLTNFESFKVVARNFMYAYGGPELNEFVDCQIFLTLTDPDEDDITDIAG